MFDPYTTYTGCRGSPEAPRSPPAAPEPFALFAENVDGRGRGGARSARGATRMWKSRGLIVSVCLITSSYDGSSSVTSKRWKTSAATSIISCHANARPCAVRGVSGGRRSGEGARTMHARMPKPKGCQALGLGGRGARGIR